MNETKVLSYNILEGLQHSQTQIDAFVEWVNNQNPDIIFYQELNGWSEEAFAALAKRCGHSFSAKLKEDGYRMGISSRFELTNIKRVTEGFLLGYVYAQTLDYHLFAVHLNAFDEEKRLQEIQQILEHAKSLPENSNIMMVGDFNSLAKSDFPAYQQWKMWEENGFLKNFFTLKSDVTDAMIEAGYTDAFAHLHSEFKQSYCTAKRFVYGDVPRRIDYAFLSPSLHDKCVSVDIVHDEITRFLSDHYPLIFTIKS